MKINGKFAGISILLLILVILTSFQNCGTQDYSNTMTAPSGAVVDLSNADQIPFAYDYVANQISYMSCSHTNDSKDGVSAIATHLDNSNTFYTFKVGAYDTAGLTLRSDFINFVKSTYSFKGTLDDQKIKDALTFGTAHKNAALQLSVRDTTPIAAALFSPSALSGSPDKISKPTDYNLFPYNRYIASTEFQSQLVDLFKNPTKRLTALGTGTVPYNLESALHYEKLPNYTEYGSQQIRNFIESNSQIKYLSVTYSEDPGEGGTSTSPEYLARSANPELSSNLAWGTGYQLKFTTPSSYPFGRSQKNNVLDKIQEVNLSLIKQPTTPGWTCPSNLRYIIVSPRDISDTGRYPCKETDYKYLSLAQQKLYTILRRHLPIDQWGIDVTNQCIYPKQPGADCYGGSNIKPIDYSKNTSTACGFDPGSNKYLDTICAEFLSVCVRN